MPIKTMSQVVEFRLAEQQIREIPLDRYRPEKPVEDVFHWYDVTGSDPDLLQSFCGKIGIDPAAFEDFQAEPLFPHLEEREESLLIFLPTMDGNRCLFYLTAHYLLTLCPKPIASLETVRQILRKEFRHAQSPGFLLFLFFDEETDFWASWLARLEDELDVVEDKIHGEFDPGVNEEIFRLKKRILTAKKFLTAERDILMRLSGKKIAVITEVGRQFLSDLYTRTQHLVESLEMLREMLSSAHDSSMSVLSQRMNEVIKILTVFSAIFFPMTLLPTFFGMNFAVIPGAHWRYGFWICVGSVALIGALFAYYFKRRGWL